MRMDGGMKDIFQGILELPEGVWKSKGSTGPTPTNRLLHITTQRWRWTW